MASPLLESFRLAGGTALSLQKGHRLSEGIDLFGDSPYGSIDFKAIDRFIETSFPYHNHISNLAPAMGKTYTIGTSKGNAVRLDIFYTDAFIKPPLIEDHIRMAVTEEIIAMKIEAVQYGGRKKDFWDLHELLFQHDIRSMLALHKQRYPYTHDKALILKNFTNFEVADGDFDPTCLRGKYWELIKADIAEVVKQYQNNLP